jgi:hypothetical protein
MHFFILSSYKQPPCIKSIIYVIAELKKERVNIDDPRQRRKVLKERKEKWPKILKLLTVKSQE